MGGAGVGGTMPWFAQDWTGLSSYPGITISSIHLTLKSVPVWMIKYMVILIEVKTGIPGKQQDMERQREGMFYTLWEPHTSS